MVYYKENETTVYQYDTEEELFAVIQEYLDEIKNCYKSHSLDCTELDHFIEYATYTASGFNFSKFYKLSKVLTDLKWSYRCDCIVSGEILV